MRCGDRESALHYQSTRAPFDKVFDTASTAVDTGFFYAARQLLSQPMLHAAVRVMHRFVNVKELDKNRSRQP